MSDHSTKARPGDLPPAAGTDHPLREIARLGQAVWLDGLDRELLESGGLARLIADDGVTGVTTNPAIFQQAFGGEAYDRPLAALRNGGVTEPLALYEALAVDDVQAAADALRGVYERQNGADGYVSLEVSPHLAHRTEATVAEARRLWRRVERPNLMIKVPATPEGLAAVRRLTAEGVNVNVTLLFSLAQLFAAASAYMDGLEDRLAAGRDLRVVHGVASVFISRIDGRIDAEIDRRLTTAADAAARTLRRLRGKIAIANAQIAYHRHTELLAQPRWRKLAEAGAAPQRLLWGSTGVKDPAYPDVYYVESLIGPGTINTMPLQTLLAVRDHAVAKLRLLEDPAAPDRVLHLAQDCGLDLEAVCNALLDDGVARFAAAFDALLHALAERRLGP